eukprot:CAMPEP_0174251978 /NCGR_PEP_ID=MMETSP0439-20130205/1639_1 /TAXON_ID=0 /ORGANISM="Stereomyxa ramosa, Strain Chinc5" /LENGTH=431 /DNA_ID=CAMNT_0015332441 /DNA_START=156 /DNA_END=1451 /DNA_ORIENTATION=+
MEKAEKKEESPIDLDFVKAQQELYQSTLFEVIHFWSKNSPDYEYGGYFSCLDETGKPYDTDKFVWLQAREVWMYSRLYTTLTTEDSFPPHIHFHEERKKWLQLARLGADFLREHGEDPETGGYYFSLNQKGDPLVSPYNIFSDFFTCMAFALYGEASGEEWAKKKAAEIFKRIEIRKDNPKGKWNKAITRTRSFEALSVPIIDINLCIELLDLRDLRDYGLTTEEVEQRVDRNLELIFSTFLDKKKNIFHENVSNKSEDNDSFDGRVIIPGHGMEALWFMMYAAERRNKTELIDKCADVLLSTMEFGWDDKYDGFFYFMDIEGKPTQQLEWDQKLWWVHLEALIATSLAYKMTKREVFMDWYKKISNYSWSHFNDPKYHEWWGYLNRRGEVILNLKGGKWKGFFHVPRGMLLVYNIFKELELSMTTNQVQT